MKINGENSEKRQVRVNPHKEQWPETKDQMDITCECVSPGRHVCGEGDTVGYEGQWCGPCDVLPLGRRRPSCGKQTKIILYTSHYTFLLSSLFDNRLLFFSTSLIHRSCSSSFLRYSHLWCCKADEDRGQRLLCDHWDDLLQIWVGQGSSSWWVYGTFFSWAPRWRWDWMWPCSRGRPSPGRLVRAGPEHQPRTMKRCRVNDCHDCWRL